MDCPKCGKKIADGHMYCEDCGHEINLVPEFEAEVEKSMAESIRGIVDQADLSEDMAEVKEKGKPARSLKNVLFFVSGSTLTVFAFVAAFVIVACMTIWNHSTFIHEMIVEYYTDDGDMDSAISYMEQTIQKSPHIAAHRFKLCELYIASGQDEKALEIYKIIAASSQFTFEEQLAAAEQIVQYYTSTKDYESVAEYLNTLQNENMQLAFWEYMAPTVNFSQPEGNYASLITLKLDSDGIGTIHYTTDGTTPTAESPEFSGTIFLEVGENTISAVFINEFGVSGQVVTKNYFIEDKKVSPPEVLTYSGTYTCPVKVEATAGYGCRIYYTTDGTVPTAYSNRYTEPLHAPIGKSVYKFIAVDSKGRYSEVITRDIQINLDTDMTTEVAEKLLVDHMINQGMVPDGSGHIQLDETHILIYEYLYPMSVAVGQDCYYFAEVSRDVTSQEQHRTGTYYGVDIRTKEIYTFTQ